MTDRGSKASKRINYLGTCIIFRMRDLANRFSIPCDSRLEISKIKKRTARSLVLLVFAAAAAAAGVPPHMGSLCVRSCTLVL